MLKKTDIKNLIQTDSDFLWLNKDTPIKMIAKVLSPEGIHAILLGSPEKLEGIITHIDIVKATLSNNYSKLKAENIMSHPIVTYDLKAPISDLITKFIYTKFVIIPLTENGKVIGVISMNDLFKYLYNDY